MVVSRAVAVPLVLALLLLAISQNWFGAHEHYSAVTQWVSDGLAENLGGGFAAPQP